MGICGSAENDGGAQQRQAGGGNRPLSVQQQQQQQQQRQVQQQQNRNAPPRVVAQAVTRQPWDYEYRSWSDEQLQQHRKIWWETRVTNLPEVWHAIRLYVETSDENTRKSITASVGLTQFQADEKNSIVFCYDRKGAQYDIPYVILKNPSRVYDAQGAVVQKAKDEDEIKREKSQLSVKLRLSNGVDFKVTTMGTETIGNLKKRICEEYKIAPERQRILHQGVLFTDASTSLAKAGMKQTNPPTVIQVFIIPDDVPLNRR